MFSKCDFAVVEAMPSVTAVSTKVPPRRRLDSTRVSAGVRSKAAAAAAAVAWLPDDRFRAVPRGSCLRRRLVRGAWDGWSERLDEPIGARPSLTGTRLAE